MTFDQDYWHAMLLNKNLIASAVCIFNWILRCTSRFLRHLAYIHACAAIDDYEELQCKYEKNQQQVCDWVCIYNIRICLFII